MLSLHNVGSAGQALHYFSKDNYYTTDQGLEHSAWFGKGAAALGLNGQVDRDGFFKLLSGRVGTQQLGRVIIDEKGEPEVMHRPGIDLTFSAPKSVSIAAEVFEDHQVRHAHEEAVKEALAYVEAVAAQARKTEDGQTLSEDTGNIVAALFRHNTSRDLDPDTHTHALIMNATQRTDGEWRSLVNDSLYLQQKLIGAIYTSSLARGLQKRGYAITAPDKNGNFELVGVTREQIEHFSQRSAARDRWLVENGIDPAAATPAEKERATLATRQRKVEVDHDALSGQWRARAQAIGLDYNAIHDRAQQSRDAGEDARAVKMTGREALSFAAAHLGEREQVFGPNDLRKTAIEHAVGRAAHQDILKAYDKLVDEGKIIVLPDRNITTKKLLETEQWTIAKALSARGTVPAIGTEDHVRGRIDQIEQSMRLERAQPDFGFTSGQRDGVVLATTSRDRFVAVQGLAGVGKTTMVKATVQISQEHSYLVRGMAPTGKAAQQLSHDAGIEAQTVTMFEIHEKRRQEDLKHLRQYVPDLKREREVWIVDEASFLAQRQMARLLYMAEQADAKVVLLGDKLQLQAIEAGKPFEILQDEGLATARMTQIQRQKNPELQKAVAITVGSDGLAPGEPLTDLNLARNARAFQFLEEAGRVTEIPEPAALIDHLAEQYVARGERRNETIVITPFNTDRKDINDAVRTKLIERGELDARESDHTILESVDMTRAQQKEAQYYEPGMQVRFGRDYQKILAARGEYMTVVGVSGDDGIVSLRKGDGTTLEWEPKKYNRVEVYEEKERQLAARDMIRFTRGDELVKNGHEATVVSISGNQAVLRLSDGKEIPWDLDAQRHWDHAYAATIHAAQGATREQAMLHIPSEKLEPRGPLTELRQNDVAAVVRRIFGDRSFYVGETRPVDDLQVYTTSAAGARWAVTQHQDKPSAVEALREHERPMQLTNSSQQQGKRAIQQMQIEPD